MAVTHFLLPALRGLDPLSSPLFDEFPLEFSQASEDVINQASGRCANDIGQRQINTSTDYYK